MTCGHRRGQNAVVNGSLTIWNCQKRGICTEHDAGRKMMDGSLMPVCDTCELHTERTGQKQAFLTIGMAYYRDWPGLWATIQSLRLHHQAAMEHVEIVVIDNDPNGNPDDPSEDSHSGKAKRLCNRIGARYEHFTKVAGTAAAKGRIFDVATGEWVLVVDCHVLLPTLTLDLFIGWIRQQPADCKDLIHGPLIGDGGLDDIIGTQMNPGWGSLMYGQWGVNPLVHTSLEPFEIQMHGCGLFACRRDQWPGFHPLLRGFGPEEWHIHQRIRRNGGKIYCLPFLKWCHRFGNPDGTRPPGLAPEDRLRGHLITWLDTGNGDSKWFDGCKRHFLESGMTEKLFAQTFIQTRQEFNGHTVGDKLAEILKECGIPETTCQACIEWRRKMNQWGADICDTEKRPAIVARLNHEASHASWLEIIRVAGHGYLTTESILDEALKRSRRE